MLLAQLTGSLPHLVAIIFQMVEIVCVVITRNNLYIKKLCSTSRIYDGIVVTEMMLSELCLAFDESPRCKYTQRFFEKKPNVM